MRRKGISPVIATVIIVAVAIAIAIAVAFWMTGIIGLFTRFEKIEVSYCYAEWQDDHWLVHIKARNTGSADATITNIFINGKPYDAWTGEVTSVKIGSSKDSTRPFNSTTGYPLSSGQTVYIDIEIKKVDNGNFNHGMSVEFKIVTASGQEYPKMTNLP